MRRKRKPPKKKIHALDKYIILCLTVIILYTIAHTIIFAVTGLEAKVLDTLVYGAFAGEMLFCFFIKKLKLHNEAKIVFGKTNNDTEVDNYTDEEGVD